MNNKGAILIQNQKGEIIKWFKTWHQGGKQDIAKVEIKFKDQHGDKKVLIKQYNGTKNTVALCKCVEAVIKYWPRYNPTKYEIVISAGHMHSTTKKKKRKRKG